MSLFDRVARHFRGNGTTPPQYPQAEKLVTVGIVERGGLLMFCPRETPVRGVKLVTVPESLIFREAEAGGQYMAMQAELRALTPALRPRRKKERTELTGRRCDS